MTEPAIHGLLCWGVLGLSAFVFVLLIFVSAPYGRHERSGWGWTLPGRTAWVVMESVSCLGFGLIYLMGDHRGASVPLVLLAMWQLHYFYRAFIYPFRGQGTQAPMPVLVLLFGITFNLINAYINGRYVSHLGQWSSSWFTDPRFIIGVVVFFTGRQINLDADARLRALRRKTSQRYSIPRGGLYRWVSCPNYFGEIIEWVGFAVACWSLAGAAFAAFTCANLAPRALAHHRWYQERFADYPKRRKALVPLLW